MKGKRVTGLAREFDTFIFDWDGTLSSVKLMRLLNEKLNPSWKYKKAKSVENPDKGRNVVHYKRDTSAQVQFGERFIAPLIDLSMLVMKPKLQKGVLQLLETLKKGNKTIALFTNGATYRVTRELVHLGIEDYFEVIVSAQDVKVLKPNPLGLAVAMRAIGAKRSKTIYVGDMVDDVLMAKRIHVKVCAVACGFDNYEKLSAAEPDYIFSGIEGFRRAL